MNRLTKVAGLAAVILWVASPAYAGGSDSPTPYSVTTEGITLPSGSVFEDNGHVNIKTDQGPRNMHFEGKCVNRTDAECAGKRHDDAQYIGKSFIPWSAFGLSGKFCVTWVQINKYNEHFGEGGQPPICIGEPCVTHSPEPTEEPTETPTEEPTSSPSPSETPTETPTESPSPEPSPSTTSPNPEPTETSPTSPPEVTPEPTDTAGPTVIPTPSPEGSVSGISPRPQIIPSDTTTATQQENRNVNLADTGTRTAYILVFVVIFLAGGISLVIIRRKYAE